MEGIVALVMIFGMPVFIVGLSKYFKFRTRKLELQERGAGAVEREQLAALREQRLLLEQRVQNLETVVTSVDFELNTRLNRLAAHQSQLLLAPPAPPGPVAVSVDAPTVAAAPAGPPAVAASVRVPAAATATAPTVVALASTGELPPGDTLMDRFELKQTIGQGGMGAVYLARDRQLGEDVALKVIAHNLVEDPQAAERFRREVGAARKITHPNVIRIHDLGDHRGLLFLTMEYFAGETLQQLLDRSGRLPLDQGRAVLAPVCEAVEAAHRAGVVHRDLKPPNILVNAEGQVRVIDFGLAKASYMMSQTATGLILGTPEYMAPEQVRGEPVDHRADIYALAAVSFCVLCGRPPFRAETPIAVGFQQCSLPPPSPRELAPELPEAVERAILKGLAKEPDERFASAAAFKQALAGA